MTQTATISPDLQRPAVPEFERTAASIAEALVESAGVEAGDRVLALGDARGRVARAAAARGAVLHVVDPALVELPFADDEFDHALSSFGLMWSPRPSATASEMVRVTRSDGTVACTVWGDAVSAGALRRMRSLVSDFEVTLGSFRSGAEAPGERYCVISGRK